MKKFIILLALVAGFAVADDNVDYGTGESSFRKVRQVAEQTVGAAFTVGTTSQYISFVRPTLSVLVVNDHTTNTLYLSLGVVSALNEDNSGMYTTAGSALVDFNKVITSWGLRVGDLVVLNEGDANDGVYSIRSLVPNTNKAYLDRNLSVTHNANQDYTLTGIPILHGETLSLDAGTQNISLIASGASTDARLIVSYQKER